METMKKRSTKTLYFAILGTLFAFVTGFLPVIAIAGFMALSFLPGIPGVIGNNNLDVAELTEKEEKFLGHVMTQLDKKATEFKMGLIDEEKFTTEIQTLKDSLKDHPTGEQYAALKEDLTKLEKALKDQGEKMTQMSEVKIDVQNHGQITREAIKEILESEDYQNWDKNNQQGHTPAFEVDVKATTGMSSYTGSALISQDSGRIISPAQRKINIRDIIATETADDPYIVYQQEYDIDYEATVYAENTELTEYVFKVKEVQTGVKRIGTSLRISKRMLRSVNWLSSHLTNKLPGVVKYNEDFEILHGDGSGNHLDGLIKNGTAFNVSGGTVTAGDISSVASWNSDAAVLVTFAAAHGLQSGDILTIANATPAAYNAAHNVIVKSLTEIIIDVAYTAEADTSAYSGTWKNPFYLAIDEANEYDVLMVSLTLLVRSYYQGTGIVMNPVDATKIELLKDSTGRYLGIKRENGVLYVSGVPVVETTAMGAGKFMVGDFQQATALAQFSPLTIQFAEDVTTKKKNEIVLIADEEVILPIYNTNMFIHGVFSTAKAALETA